MDRQVQVINRFGLPKPFHRVGIYCRVSTNHVAQLDSLSKQVSYLTQLVAARNDWMLRDTYIDFESGKDSRNRDNFRRMVQDCKDGKLDIIVTRTVARFGRNIEDIIIRLRELKDSNVTVYFVQENLKSDEANSELLISVVSAIAEADNRSRSQNIMWGIHRQLESGKSSIYSRPCYGYDKNEHGELVIDREQAENVRLIFDLYLSGKSVLGIIDELYSRGIKSPTGQEKWCKRSIDTMLSNEKYAGDVIVVKTYTLPNGKRQKNRGEKGQFQAVGDHPAIIEKETFDKVQEEKNRRSNVIEENGQRKRKATKFSSKNPGNTDNIQYRVSFIKHS